MSNVTISKLFLAGAMLAFSCSVSHATTTRDAIIACDKNPKCQWDDQGNGMIVLTVPGGGVVVCEKKAGGTCEVQKRPVVKGVKIKGPILNLLNGKAQ